MSQPVEVIFIDDEEHLRLSAAQTLDLAGFPARTFASAEEVLPLISRTCRAVVVTDIRMGGMDGMTLLKQIQDIDAELPVVLVTGHGDINLAVEAMRHGAYDFIEKPFAAERFLDSVTRALEKRQLTLENRKLRETLTDRRDDLEHRLPGRVPAMTAIRYQIRAAAQSSADVLIVGETGTGKEVVARAIHDLSHDTERPFIIINCAAMQPGQIEAELLGYEAGAFPGAVRARFGRLEHGRNGTIFLDRIEHMPPEMQGVMLTVLQHRAIMRLGSTDTIPLNCRFVASSAIDLEAAIREPKSGTPFSPDLLYRLNVATLRLPPLRERLEDVPLLFQEVLAEAATRSRRDVPPPPPGAFIAKLLAHDWPGNVRELRNAAERYLLGLDPDALTSAAVEGETGLKARVEAFEREAIAAELRATNGNITETYTHLGLSRKSLYEKMQKYGLDKDSFKTDTP